MNLSLFVARFEEYRPYLIQHLVERKMSHWDTVIRQLTAKVVFHNDCSVACLLFKTMLLQL